MRRSLVLILDAIDDIVEYARRAEDAAFEAVWLTDFYNRDAFVRMAMAGQATSRIGIASGIAYAFARSPVLTAAAAADIDEITGGRTILGLGTGTRRMQESWYGPEVRGACAEGGGGRAAAARAVGGAGRPAVQARGPVLQHRHRPLRPPGARARSHPGVPRRRQQRSWCARPARSPTASSGTRCTRGGISLKPWCPPSADGLARGGRERSSFDLAGYVITSISDDAAQAREEARRQIGFYATTLTYDAILDLHGWEKEKQAIRAAWKKFDIAALSAAVSDDMLDQIAIAGTPDDCRKQFERYEGLLDHVLLYPPSFGVRPERVKENYAAIMQTSSVRRAEAREQ